MPVWQSDGKNGRKPKRRYVSYHQQKLMSKLTTISLKILGQKMTPMIFTLRGKYRADHSVFLVIFLSSTGLLSKCIQHRQVATSHIAWNPWKYVNVGMKLLLSGVRTIIRIYIELVGKRQSKRFTQKSRSIATPAMGLNNCCIWNIIDSKMLFKNEISSRTAAGFSLGRKV